MPLSYIDDYEELVNLVGYEIADILVEDLGVEEIHNIMSE